MPSSLDTYKYPNTKIAFDIADILVSIISDKHHLYKGSIGQELASLIWNYFQVYIIKCRTAQTTPISTIVIHEIKSQVNRVLKILPKSKLATFIKASPELQNMFHENKHAV